LSSKIGQKFGPISGGDADMVKAKRSNIVDCYYLARALYNWSESEKSEKWVLVGIHFKRQEKLQSQSVVTTCIWI
jgi:hypothetical protein